MEIIRACQHCKRIMPSQSLDASGKPMILEFQKDNCLRILHGICRECIYEHYPDMADELISDLEETEWEGDHE